jgi:serine/threonine-protein kinase
MKKQLLPILLIAVMLSACKKGGTGDTGASNTSGVSFSIIDFTPITGSLSTNVTITGTNFSNNIADDVVKFNGVTTTVSSATPTELIVGVPLNATTGKITVTINGVTATSATDFHIATVTTFAGNGVAGFADGTGSSAQFNCPEAIAIDASNNLYVADFKNHSIRKITPAGVVSTLAGSSVAGNKDGTGAAAEFQYPSGVTVDASNNVYVTDIMNSNVRKITPAGVVTTVAQLDHADGITIDAAGNLYVIDNAANLIFKMTTAGVVSGNNINPGLLPADLKVDAAGYIYAPGGQNQVFKLAQNANYNLSGTVTAIAGKTSSYSTGQIGVDGPAANAVFNGPYGIALDATGNIYIADLLSIRKIFADASGNLFVTTLAGNGKAGLQDGSATIAEFNNPRGIAIDASGNLYVADYANNCIRKIVP